LCEFRAARRVTGFIPESCQAFRSFADIFINFSVGKVALAPAPAARHVSKEPRMLFSSSRDQSSMLDALNKSQAVIEFNMDGTIITANQNFLDALGYSLEEIKGKHHRMFVTEVERDSAAYREFWETLNCGKFQAAEYKRIGRAARRSGIQASYNPLMRAASRTRWSNSPPISRRRRCWRSTRTDRSRRSTSRRP
jgi:PAS domain S-box-containing protein